MMVVDDGTQAMITCRSGGDGRGIPCGGRQSWNAMVDSSPCSSSQTTNKRKMAASP